MTERKHAEWRRWCRWIACAAAFVAGGGLIAFVAIVPQAGGDPAARVDAIRTAWTVTAGLGGLVVIALAIRNAWHQKQMLLLQRDLYQLQSETFELSRQSHELQVRKDDLDRAEARSQHVDDQFDQAVAKLGADTVAARIAGVKALNRLGHEHPELRDEIAEVWCALLRTRVADPTEQDDVRALVQRLLLEHLRAPYEGTPTSTVDEAHTDYWTLRRIDLGGADLIDADFSDCLLPNFYARQARFHGATRFAKARFIGPATFTNAQCTGPVELTSACFMDECTMDSMRFADSADFTEAVFRGLLECSTATFAGPAVFVNAQFLHTARFVKSSFLGTADFGSSAWVFRAEFTLAVFEDYAGFGNARFVDRAVFGRATFGAAVSFERAKFGRNATFTGIECCGTASFNNAHFDEDVAFDDAQFADTAGFRRTRFRGQVSYCGAQFDALAAFGSAKFDGRVDFSSTRFGEGAGVDCADATAAPGDYLPSDRIWPPGWTTIDMVTVLLLVPVPDPRTDLAPVLQTPTTRTT